MIDMVLSLWANQWIAFVLYWLPLAFCAIGYTMRTARNLAKDRRRRVSPGAFYRPTDTVGTLMRRAIITVMPIGNVFAAVLDLAPHVCARCVDCWDELLHQPLVPDLPDGEQIRRDKANV